MNLKIYNFIILTLFPIILAFFFFRILLGKEDKKRFLEKLSFFSVKKPLKKKIIWFHACSVGEVKSIYNLIRKFILSDYSVLVTTNTFLSAVDIKKNFSNTIIHQYLPFDFKILNRRFLSYWKPSIAVIVESELWPNLIYNAKSNKIPICWIQARISDKSLKKWLLMGNFLKEVLSNFTFIISQSNLEKRKLENTGVKIKNVINLKFSSQKLEINKKDQFLLKKSLKNKSVVAAISTHEGEEKIILKVFKQLLKKHNNLILILQPRHPVRRKKILKEIKKFELNFKQRSLKEMPDKKSQVFLFDSFGESGLVISLASIVILGGTFVPIGGHNIIEAAQFKKCIISGPYHHKISEIFHYFKKNKAIVLAKNINLEKKISSLMVNKNKKKSLENNAFELTSKFKDSSLYIFNNIKKTEN